MNGSKKNIISTSNKQHYGNRIIESNLCLLLFLGAPARGSDLSHTTGSG